MDRYLNAMLKAVKLPTRISNLDTGLVDVDQDALPHGTVRMVERRRKLEGGGEKSFGSQREASTKTSSSAVLSWGLVQKILLFYLLYLSTNKYTSSFSRGQIF